MTLNTIAADDTAQGVLEELTDEELERELTLAALSEHRQLRFDLLLRERRRRLAARKQQQ